MSGDGDDDRSTDDSGDDARPADGAGDGDTSPSGDDAGDPIRVVAQGTFDLLHPGHVHYLEDAAAHGDELHVIVARAANVTHKADPVVPEGQRRELVAALEAVDHARLGHPEDIFVPIEEIDPDVIVLGHDQHHDEAALRDELERRGIHCRIERASAREPRGDEELLSTGRIIERVLEERRE